ncbi:hypothetical protein ACOMHN_002673 [Nucella lapillus]
MYYEGLVKRVHNDTFTVHKSCVLPVSASVAKDHSGGSSSSGTSIHESTSEDSGHSSHRTLKTAGLKPHGHSEHLRISAMRSKGENLKAKRDTDLATILAEKAGKPESSYESESPDRMTMRERHTKKSSVSLTECGVCNDFTEDDSLLDPNEESGECQKEGTNDESSSESRYSSCSSEELRHQFHLNSHLYNVLGCEDCFRVSSNTQDTADDQSLELSSEKIQDRSQGYASSHNPRRTSNRDRSPNDDPWMKQQTGLILDDLSLWGRGDEALETTEQQGEGSEGDTEPSDFGDERDRFAMIVLPEVCGQDHETKQDQSEDVRVKDRNNHSDGGQKEHTPSMLDAEVCTKSPNTQDLDAKDGIPFFTERTPSLSKPDPGCSATKFSRSLCYNVPLKTPQHTNTRADNNPACFDSKPALSDCATSCDTKEDLQTRSTQHTDLGGERATINYASNGTMQSVLNDPEAANPSLQREGTALHRLWNNASEQLQRLKARSDSLVHSLRENVRPVCAEYVQRRDHTLRLIRSHLQPLYLVEDPGEDQDDVHGEDANQNNMEGAGDGEDSDQDISAASGRGGGWSPQERIRAAFRLVCLSVVVMALIPEQYKAVCSFVSMLFLCLVLL